MTEGKIVGEIEMPAWIPERVRDLLPDVQVNVGGKEFLGKVRSHGVLNLAEVSLCLPVKGTRVSVMVTYAWSWEAIANALNTGRGLTL